MRTTILLLVLLRICMSMNTSPKCNQCKHFIPAIMKDEYYIGDYLGKCNKFMRIDDSINEIKFRYAIQSRTYDDMCGKKGRLFEPKTNDTNYDTLI